MYDYSIINKAGISIGEFAAMIVVKDAEGNKRTVSRTAVYNWVRGKSAPSEAAALRISKVLRILESAVNAGDMPVNIALNREDRKQAVLEAVKKHLALV